MKRVIITLLFMVATAIPLPAQNCVNVPAAAIVDAGTERIKGLYTCRGTFFSRPFFTRADQPTDTDLYAIIHSLGVWYVSDFQTDVVYYADDLAMYPWEVKSWTFSHDGSAPAPRILPIKY